MRPSWLKTAQEWCSQELFEYIEVKPLSHKQMEPLCSSCRSCFATDTTPGLVLLSRLTAMQAVKRRFIWLSHLTVELYKGQSLDGTSQLQAAPFAPDVDNQLMLDGEPQGVQRILAALQAHTWPGLRMKQSEKAVTGQRNPDAEQSGLLYSGAEDARKESGTARGDESAASGPQPLAARDSLAGVYTVPNEEPGTEGRSEEELERDMNQFESMMSEVATARSQLQSLSDHDRRRAAEDLTLKLVSRFGLEECSDSESE